MKQSAPISRPIQRTPVDRIGYRFQRFSHIEGISGILLVAATLLALILANSPLADAYFNLLNTHFIIGIDSKVTIDEPLLLWINDALMAIFFFVVGLELKREVAIGELSTRQKAILPALAAVGGMIVPVAFFWALNANDPVAMKGWAIPMATDIAFAMGVLALVGRKAPLSLAVFLTALAIVDDIGAILVIAIFYTAQIDFLMLLAGLALVIILLLYARAGGRDILIFMLVGGLVWLAIFFSGLHATIAGVLVALTIPVRTRVATRDFSQWMRQLLTWFESGQVESENDVPTAIQRAALQEMNQAIDHVDSPLHRLEHALHPWVAFLIMPVFALANAGIIINATMLKSLLAPLALGIIVGLLFGKTLGIYLAAWLGVKLKLGTLPVGVGWRHILGAGVLAGMGFTMSIFIATLAFSTSDAHAGLMGFKLASPRLGAEMDMESLQALSKFAILIASTLAGGLGYLILRTAPAPPTPSPRVTPPARQETD